jgi:hypothetical protein
MRKQVMIPVNFEAPKEFERTVSDKIEAHC